MNKLLIVIPIITIIAISGVYFLFIPRNSNPPDGPLQTFPPGISPSVSPSGTDILVRYKAVNYVDSGGIGTKAFGMIIPLDWQHDGSVNWVLDNPAMPATGTFRAWNPTGAEEFNVLPNQAFFWSDNPMLTQTFPAGSLYFGAEVRYPLGVLEALEQIALPLFRSQVQNLVVVSQEELPQLSATFETGTDPASGTSSSANAGKIRFEYTLNGVLMEEEMYCVLQSLNIPIPTLLGTYTNVNWYMTYLESFRAERGQLDYSSKMFQTISFSAKTDANWLNKYNQVVEYLIQNEIKQIQSLGQLSSIVSQTNNEISDANYEAWTQSQTVKDQLADDFSQYIRGVETYNSPIDGNSVELPSGYSTAWTNNLGEYVLSDSSSYNPNIGSNLNWQQMTTP